MENQKIKEDRRRKFLEKMESRNKANKGNKKQSNNNPNNNNTSIPQNKIDTPQQNKNTINQSPFFNMASTPNINNINQNQAKDLLNNIFNNQNKNKKEIDFKNIIEQTDKYDYMINFQNILKKILIIILSIIHCFNYPPLNNIFVFKYTFIILELSSVFFNKYYYSKKADLRKMIVDPNKDNEYQNQITKMIQSILNNFGFVSQIFVFFKAIKDVFSDICIFVIINSIYFIIKAKD